MLCYVKLVDQVRPNNYHRERSQSSVTPATSRRMSAASFVALQTPILSTNNETGQLSFLRSNTNRTLSFPNHITSTSQYQVVITNKGYSYIQNHV